jgi:hypothetical protein
MYVLKRDGRKESVSFDKITSRIKRLSWGLPQEFCDPVRSRLLNGAFQTAALPLIAVAAPTCAACARPVGC